MKKAALPTDPQAAALKKLDAGWHITHDDDVFGGKAWICTSGREPVKLHGLTFNGLREREYIFVTSRAFADYRYAISAAGRAALAAYMAAR
jgi:hypothetical protein